ncbi:MAG: hypothetical protein F6J93_11615 [Oscillatoria sp. SIO1A7]|nr:hypothetical protein [Oscillatoria sp. SIO1A7]
MSKQNLVDATNFIVPVWGEKYVNEFLEIGLRSCLTENNFPCLPQSPRSCLRIITEFTDLHSIESNPLINKAQEYLDVEILILENLKSSYKYDGMRKSHIYGMSKSPRYAYNVFLCADNFMGDSVIPFLLKKQHTKWKAVMGLGLCVQKPEFENFLNNQYFSEGKTNQKDALLRAMLECRHSYLRNIDVQNNQGRLSLSSCLIWFFEQGFITHGHYLHPIMVAYPDNDSYLDHYGTIDGGDFVRRLGYRKQDFYVVCDFKDLPFVSVDDSERLSSYLRPDDTSCLDFFVHRNFDPQYNHINQYFFEHKIFLNIGGDTSIESSNCINYAQTMNRLAFYDRFDWVIRASTKTKRIVFSTAKFILLKLKLYDNVKSYIKRLGENT